MNRNRILLFLLRRLVVRVYGWRLKIFAIKQVK